jgi:hypothetical protein
MEFKKHNFSNFKVIFISFKKSLIFFSMNFFTPKFRKIRCFILLFEAFDTHFYIKWAIYVLILIFKFVSIHVQEFFLVEGGLGQEIQNYKTYIFFLKTLM